MARVLVLLVTTALLLSACGGGSSSEDIASGDLTTSTSVVVAPIEDPTTSTAPAGPTTTQVATTRSPRTTSTARPTTSTTQSQLTTSTARPTTSTTRAVRPPPAGPYNGEFVNTTNEKWYPLLKDLDPAKCALLVQKTTPFTKGPQGSHQNGIFMESFVFRAGARGCTGDLAGSRMDLACGEALRTRLSTYDPKAVALLDWAIEAYGPAQRTCTSNLSPATTTTIR